MNLIFNEKILFYLSVVIGAYFILLGLNAYVIKSEHVIMGVIREMVTIPIILIQIILLVFSIKYCLNNRFNIREYSFWAFSILLLTNLLILGTIVIAIFS